MYTQILNILMFSNLVIIPAPPPPVSALRETDAYEIRDTDSLENRITD